MKGYLNRPEETREAFFGEWFRTGDLGYVDEEGYFFIVDRKKDMIIVNGMNVYPRMIEEVIQRHPSVAEVAVVRSRTGSTGRCARGNRSQAGHERREERDRRALPEASREA